MRFLVDNALSRLVAGGLANAGHEAVHVRDYDMQGAVDDDVLFKAEVEQRILVSADTDFGTLLARTGKAKPSVIQFRRGSPRRPAEQVALLLANLPAIEQDLERGAIVVFERGRLRIRSLPIETDQSGRPS